MFEEILFKMLPKRGEIEVDFDAKRRVFRLSSPIFSSQEMPKQVKEYVEAREGMTFKPHSTLFRVEGHEIRLIQEVPFNFGFQETLRMQIDRFKAMSKVCRERFAEMALEEKYQNLDSHFA
jgi:mRNA-degrading endonuclease HigB of HigAB toxin-antitoxin module